MTFNPDMLILARESRGMTQTQLADALRLSQAKVSKLEAGMGAVSDDDIKKMSRALRYPESFFHQNETRLGLGPSELYHYRKRQSVGAKRLDLHHACIDLRRIHIARLLRSVEMNAHLPMPEWDVEDFRGGAAEAARALRATWHVPRGPIRNLTTLIEDAGGIIVPYNFDGDAIDAISRRVAKFPAAFFVSTTLDAARYRYTLAHELAHVVLHRVPNPAMESQADAFAAELLMPADDVRPYLTNISLAKLAGLKPYWRVSMAALLKRAADLGRLTPSQEKGLWIAMGRAGYRSQEPPELEFTREEPALLGRLLSAHFEELKYSLSDLAALLNVYPDEVVATYSLGRKAIRAVADWQTFETREPR